MPNGQRLVEIGKQRSPIQPNDSIENTAKNRPTSPQKSKPFLFTKTGQAGSLQNRIASKFWELKAPKKKQVWLDIGCGLSFLIYPWYEWDAVFYGQEVSTIARDIVVSRGPQLNSKLFHGVTLGGAHLLDYDAGQFDGAIATGWSCYYPLAYWERVLVEVKHVLKPSGSFIFDVIDPDSPLAEDWGDSRDLSGDRRIIDTAGGMAQSGTSSWRQNYQKCVLVSCFSACLFNFLSGCELKLGEHGCWSNPPPRVSSMCSQEVSSTETNSFIVILPANK